MFSLEDGSETKTVPDAPEFLANALNIWDDDSALVYCVRSGTICSRRFHYGVNEFLWILIEHQIMPYGLNFVVKILLILIHDFCSVDQAMNYSSFHVMWVVGLEVQVATSLSRIPVHFCDQFWTPLHNQDVQEWKGIVSLNFPS
jgi:hypothetical protein